MPLSDKEILKQAKRRYDECYHHWNHMQNENTELLEFISGEQWTAITRQNFENQGYAAMTSNRLPTFLRQITNELVKNTPEGQIDPRTDADKGKADVLNDLIRNIQEESHAKVAYCKAAEMAAAVGIGYFRIMTKFKDNKSMDQEIIIEPIDDVNTVMLDPNHKGLCGQDCEYAFISTTLTVDEYQRKYGKTKLGRKLRGDQTGEDLTDELKDVSWSKSEKKWTEKNQVLIAEYYFKDYSKKTLYQVFDSRTGKTFTTYNKEDIQDDMTILQSRDLEIPVVRWCKLNDMEVLEQTEWPGCYIPVVCVKADEYWIAGKRTLVGAVKPAIEAQVELNYAKSWRGMLLQMSPTAPWILTAAQVKDYEEDWKNANVAKFAYLTYNVDATGGSVAPPPQRNTFEAPIQSASLLVEGAENDLKAIFGTFDPNNQMVAPESGKAILARQDQSYNSNYHFYNNLSRSIEHGVCIMIEAVPVVYDTPREITLLSQDGKKRTVSINQPNEQGVVEYDLTVGDYTVSIQTGPSFGTKRQEMAEAVMDLIAAYPNAAPAIADLAVRQMDWAGADKIADSLEAMVPPQVLAARKVDPKNAAAMVPSLQGQLAAAQQQIQVLNMQAQKHTAEMDKAASDIKVEMLQADTEMKKAQLDNDFKMKQLQFNEEKTELEFLIKEKELEIKIAELKLKKAGVAIEGTKVAAEMLNDVHDRTIEHIDRMNPDIETDEESDTGMDEDLK
jgi:hypothetical protein